MCNYYDYFADKKRKGDVGEHMFEALCKSKGVMFDDTRSDKYAGCDYVVKGNRIEVKTQDYFIDHGYIFIELEDSTNIRYSGRGWYYTSTADYYYFYETESTSFLVVPSRVLKEVVEKALDTNNMSIMQFNTPENNFTVVGLLDSNYLRNKGCTLRRLTIIDKKETYQETC